MKREIENKKKNRKKESRWKFFMYMYYHQMLTNAICFIPFTAFQDKDAAAAYKIITKFYTSVVVFISNSYKC